MPKTNFKARLYITDPLSIDARLTISGNQSHYLRNVLRLQNGEQIALYNGRDGEWLSEIKLINKKNIEVKIQENIRSQEISADIWLAFAPIKKARIDYLAQKATELGATVMWPVFTRYTMVSRLNLDRLRANAVEASEQSGRLCVPEIRSPAKFEKFLKDWPSQRTLFCLDETGGGIPIIDAFKSCKKESSGLFIGPEGGFTNEELDQVEKLGNVFRISLGKRILRSDTAALAALACWQAMLGDWC
ncbi:MAG: 16S rRNA (uracil(1498)-N(3))-methyltransferase [Rhodospirillaceae bacterium]|nr:16S rRNA (uracil(1498)-N(3))-methyltransferase [Rhodospirillaceae bacterium]|tara:strand:+ start:2224 stop:2961 length:738 start_codon:yes stop_codon:yes gene_type:complete